MPSHDVRGGVLEQGLRRLVHVPISPIRPDQAHGLRAAVHRAAEALLGVRAAAVSRPALEAAGAATWEAALAYLYRHGFGRAMGEATDPDEAKSKATAILGMDIKGHTVHRVLVTQASDIAEEYYASFTLDRAAKQHLLMLSAQGGVEIEEVAATRPDARAMIRVDAIDGARRIGGRVGKRFGHTS